MCIINNGIHIFNLLLESSVHVKPSGEKAKHLQEALKKSSQLKGLTSDIISTFLQYWPDK